MKRRGTDNAGAHHQIVALGCSVQLHGQVPCTTTTCYLHHLLTLHRPWLLLRGASCDHRPPSKPPFLSTRFPFNDTPLSTSTSRRDSVAGSSHLTPQQTQALAVGERESQVGRHNGNPQAIDSRGASHLRPPTWRPPRLRARIHGR